ncbi:serine/threonine-protein kinase polo isoform X1 [Galleria mellonella]|uniref:polo kinase n=1 Tax=Galleria mellonella TaxID=7137 RepID=A0ABM3MQE9_GALME|nr:serine/threonine-protein kinase polo isoform X1 [Galleria mellonella]XP_052753591.1 serine/threonine-protein kinase polo isoform X1 [Galleria mellonella]XP_052753592.1 serine/threonine-protein kinase polo isoform X1 [Galleria mellonella]XP_052753593.1 serine/threonine-protein kinase polo isoform X1 [Galleria mellonella]
MTSIKEDEKKEIPEIIHDPQTSCTYQRLRFFGKGGFAKCYEIQDIATNQIYAGKIVSKKLMVKSSQKEKMAQEISIHRSLQHKHVVGFHSFFEDSLNIYIILELCKRRSMMELHKRRKAITEPETRFYMHQILLGVQYLHSKRIIHRDLKLGNLFLDDDLHVKIGDFGLAARIEYEGERKQTLCGTPNYIAPEILTKKGHSFEVDIWSLGCIMYTLLVGKPPFETSTLKDTYKRIKQCEYSEGVYLAMLLLCAGSWKSMGSRYARAVVNYNTIKHHYRIPSSLRKPAASMIVLQLQSNPARRPSVDKLLQHEFFSSGILPAALPLSCLTTAPRTDQLESMSLNRRPLNEVHSNEQTAMGVDSPVKRDLLNVEPRAVEPSSHRQNLIALRDQLAALLVSKLKCRPECLTDELSDPAAQPLVWVGKWVDYSDKYGFGYQLCDESVGVMFNDTTKLIMLANGLNVHYINRQGQEQYMTMREYPQELDKKMKLLTYFRRYMTEHLMKAGASVPVRESDGLSRLPHLHQWFRTTLAVIMYLTNGTLQINFQDHTKIILCPLMQAVTYIDMEKNFRTFRFSTIEEHGCDKKLYTNLTYALEKLNSVLANKLC